MATSRTSQSASVSGVAKDDAVGLDGDFTFRISDLLANDGGSVKDVASQFRFGTTEADWADQTAYLTKHGITANSDGSYTIHSGADDFQYMMQTGNKGTWSTANVDVTAPEPHLGDNLFSENFDGYQETQKFYDPADSSHFVFGTVNLETASGWTNASYVELGANGYGDIASTTGEAWLDTQKSQGQIDISHVFQDTTAAIEGKTAVLSFDVGVQSLDYLLQHYETNSDASLEFRIDGHVVKELTYEQIHDAVGDNMLAHFNVDITDAYYTNPGDTHTLSLVDTSPTSDYTGFSVDSIQINDWVLC